MNNGDYTLKERRERIGKTYSTHCMKCGKTFSYVSILGGSQKLCSTCKADFLESMIHRTAVSTDTYQRPENRVHRRVPFNADKLRAWLKSQKLSQSKLSVKLGTDAQTISKDLKLGRAAPLRIKQYADVMGISESDLKEVKDE